MFTRPTDWHVFISYWWTIFIHTTDGHTCISYWLIIFIPPTNGKYWYPTNGSKTFYQWILKCRPLMNMYLFFPNISYLLIFLIYPSNGQTIIMKNILMMDCSVSYQHKCFYFSKYSIYGFTFVVSNGLTIILSPYLYYDNIYVCIFNKLTSHFNNKKRFLT